MQIVHNVIARNSWGEYTIHIVILLFWPQNLCGFLCEPVLEFNGEKRKMRGKGMRGMPWEHLSGSRAKGLLFLQRALLFLIFKNWLYCLFNIVDLCIHDYKLHLKCSHRGKPRVPPTQRKVSLGLVHPTEDVASDSQRPPTSWL